MAFHPLVLDLEGWPVAVVGGGEAAATRVQALLEAGAKVTVISPDLCGALRQKLAGNGAPAPATPVTPPPRLGEAPAGSVNWIKRIYMDGDLEGTRLVFAATPSHDVNEAVAAEAARRDLPVNLPDDPEASTLEMPSWFSRGPLMVAVTSGGAGADLDRRIRRKIELQLPPLYGHLAEIVDRYRHKANEQIASLPERRAFLRELVAFLDGPEVHEDLAQGHLDGALAGAHALLDKHKQRPRRR